ncbi:uncharacterized protein [Cherax quadricarinatus]|uniref:uncharacterized protein n=1 Tax=Cherax quadricarinatus TaxID=27406 RepID=UPI00387EA38E
MHTVLGLVLALSTCALVQGLRVTAVEVPRVVLVGESATLRCHFALRGEALYSLKWWKGGRQFYQFIPRNSPKMVAFTSPGVRVNIAGSGLHQVQLVQLQRSSSGLYRCEVVGEAPTFTTHARAANLTVIDTPDGPPVVRGLHHAGYRDGEIIHLNCTSYHSWPPPILSWVLLLPDAQTSHTHTGLGFSNHAANNAITIGDFNGVKSTDHHHAHTSHDHHHAHTSHDHPHAHTSYTHHTYSHASNAIRHAHQYSKQAQYYDTSPGHKPGHNPGHKHGHKYGHNPGYKPGHKPGHNPGHNLLHYTVDEALVIRYPLRSTWAGGQDSPTSPGEVPTFSATLGLLLPASRHLAPYGSFKLRCRAEVEEYAWVTEVEIEVARTTLDEPHHLPALLNTHHAHSGGDERRNCALVMVMMTLCLAE